MASPKKSTTAELTLPDDAMIPRLHWNRWNRAMRLHKSPEAIAREDKVTVGRVRESISIVESHRALLTMDEAQMCQVETITSLADSERASIQSLLTAVARDESGKMLKDEEGHPVPDVEARYKGISSINEKMKAIRTPDRGVRIINQQVNAQTNVAPEDETRPMIFEDRLRHIIQARKQAQLPGKVADPVAERVVDVTEADEHIEGNPPQRPASR